MSQAPSTRDIVDVHTHGIPRDLPRFGQRFAGGWPELVATGECTADILVAGEHFRSIDDRCWDPSRRLADMDAEGVTLQVVSPIPVTLSYGLPADGVVELARVQNEWIAELVRGNPARFHGLGTVPLQDPERAARTVAEVAGLGLAGVEIGSNVDGRYLDDPALEPFFAACVEHRALVFVHPWAVLGAPRLRQHGLLYSVGMPAETAASAASMIMGGVLDEHPELSVVLAHGGGALLSLLPRIDRTWERLPGVGPESGGPAHPPSSYLRRFHYDSLVYHPGTLATLVRSVGAERVCTGTDYPFPIAERPAGAALDAVADTAELGPAEVRAVRSGTARGLLAP